MDVKSNFESIRQYISDKLLLVGMIVSIPAAIASGVRIFTMGFRALFGVDILIAFVLVLAYVTRNKVNYRIRMLALLAYLFMLGVISLSTFGIFGLGLFIIFFVIVTVTTLFGLRYGLFALGMATVVVAFFTIGIYLQWFNFNFDFNFLNYSTYQWFSRGIFFLCFSTMAVVTLGMVHSNFERINSKLATSEARLKLALDSVNEVVWEIDSMNNRTFVSEKIFDILHFAPHEIALNFNSWKNLIYEEDIPSVNEKINEHVKGNTPTVNLEYRIKGKSGSLQWIQTKGKIINRDINGKPTRVVGTHSDINPRKEMERILRESEQRYRTLFMGANDVILLVENFVIIDTNISAYEFFGYPVNDLVGKRFGELCPPVQWDDSDSLTGIDNIFREVKEHRFKKVEWEFLRADGKVIDALMSVNIMYDEGRPIYQVILHDISDRKQFEEAKLNAIIETEERERLKLAGDLHDEVGPLLSSLNMYLSLLNREQTTNKQEIIANMQGILKDTIGSVREISNNLSPHVLNTYGLRPAFNAIVEQGRNLIDIHFYENIGDIRLPIVLETMCYRIAKELLNNTLKYANAKSVYLSLYIKEGVLYLTFRDDGVGFDLDEKLANRKTGIGLLNIVNRLNTLKATCSISSKPGQGFSFEMKLRIKPNENEN